MAGASKFECWNDWLVMPVCRFLSANSTHINKYIYTIYINMNASGQTKRVAGGGRQTIVLWGRRRDRQLCCEGRAPGTWSCACVFSNKRRHNHSRSRTGQRRDAEDARNGENSIRASHTSVSVSYTCIQWDSQQRLDTLLTRPKIDCTRSRWFHPSPHPILPIYFVLFSVRREGAKSKKITD